MKLVGITGKKGAGKDTVAHIIKKHLPGMQLIAYADKLKEAASLLTGIPLEVFYDPSLKDVRRGGSLRTPRQYLTDMHDALVPVFGEDVFVRLVKKQYWVSTGPGIPPHPGMIVTDVRYEGRETDWIREMGGIILHVKRAKADSVVAEHSSEAGVAAAPGEFILNNEGNLFHLERQVLHFLEWWMGQDEF